MKALRAERWLLGPSSPCKVISSTVYFVLTWEWSGGIGFAHKGGFCKPTGMYEQNIFLLKVHLHNASASGWKVNKCRQESHENCYTLSNEWILCSVVILQSHSALKLYKGKCTFTNWKCFQDPQSLTSEWMCVCFAFRSICLTST